MCQCRSNFQYNATLQQCFGQNQAICNSDSDCLSIVNFGCAVSGVCTCNSNYKWNPNTSTCIQSNGSNADFFTSINMDCSSAGVCECASNCEWDTNLYTCVEQYPTSTPKIPNPAPFNITLIGCYADVINSSTRDLNGFGDSPNRIGGTSIKACVNLCSYMNFKYAGLQSGYAFKNKKNSFVL